MTGMHEYLVSYGNAGDFGRFHSTKSLTLRRGDRAVIRTPRGLEYGTVLCPTVPGHAAHLPNTSVGQLLRPGNGDDEQAERQMTARARKIFNDARELIGSLGLPIEMIDAEVLLDGEHAVLYHLRWAMSDARPFVSTLSKQHDLHIELQDLSRVSEGCGKPNCGRGEGGCSSCGTNGGCGSCGSHSGADVAAYFSELREKMAVGKRTPLL
jgi:cell fate regulator YaaT (PSP1 superfamily)